MTINNNDKKEETQKKRSKIRDIRYRSNQINLRNKIRVIKPNNEEDSLELLESHIAYRYFLESLGMVFLNISAKGEIYYLSKYINKIIDCTYYDLIKDTNLIFKFIHPEDIPNFYKLVQARKNNCKETSEAEYRLKRKDGSYFWVYQKQKAFLNSSNEVIHYNSVILDINEKKILELQVAHSSKMETIGLLTGGISHDFKNNLSAILGQIHIALNNMDESHPAYKSLLKAEEATLRSAEMTKKIVSYSNKDKELEQNQINLYSLTKETTELLNPLLLSKNIKVNLESSINKPIVKVNYTQLQQVLMNICINAKDAINKNGFINISINKISFNEDSFNKTYPDINSGEYVELKVIDSGDGISDECINHIFEPFFSTKKPSDGTGLGLNMSYSIIKSFNGYLRAYNSLNDGAVFSILLPIIDKPSNYKNTKNNSPIKSTKIQNILIADDSEVILSLFETILDKAGYNVTIAKDGQEAYDKFIASSDEFDLVILDETMPKMTGREVLCEIYKIKPNQKIIVSTGITNIDCYNILAKNKDFKIIEKPFRPDSLLKLIKDS